MVNDGHDLLALVPASDGVRWQDGRWSASAPTPWLAAPGLVALAGRWIRLTTHAGLFDERVRPLIRFRNAAGGETIWPMNGAIAGVGQWVGRVPGDAVEVAISPVSQAGCFSFALSHAAPVPRSLLLARGLWQRPRLALMAIGARLIRARAEAHHCLAFAATPTPLRAYWRWRAARTRRIDFDGFDRPHRPGSERPVIHVLLRAGPAAAVARTIVSLRGQAGVAWRLHSPHSAPDADPRVVASPATTPVAALGSANDLLVVLDAGDILLDHALAIVADFMAGNPALAACYGDDEGDDGRSTAVRLKPDHSPAFAAATGYGGAVFRRLSRFEQQTLADAAADAAPLAALPPAAIGHVRQPLLRIASLPAPPPRALAPLVGPWPEVAVIIPTKDRADLLEACLAGLRDRTDYPARRLVLVDNGTSDRRALALMAESGATVLPQPGAFNYSALCNAGAAATGAPLLLFLNNDVMALRPDWLKRLVAAAAPEDVAAVGAKLLFLNGRVQHGGDVIGIGGAASQGYRGARDDAGYLGALQHLREVSAVTGAVQLVRRRFFDAVGGFDADRFPVLFSDADLCLRLRGAGGRILLEPAATLLHAESASRGFTARPFARHAAARAAFVARWAEAIRDDPYHHPALSLMSASPALG